MSISFGGLASGLDSNAIVSSLVALERRPITLLQIQQNAQRSRLTLFGTLEGLVKTLKEKAQALATDGAFFANKLEVGNEGVATFTITGSAQEGSHVLDVTSLAAADLFTFDAQLSDTDDLITPGGGDGTVSFTYDGTNYSVTIPEGSSSLNDVRDAINNNAGNAVTASVVNVGTAASPSYELLITGDDTGSDFAITGLTASANLGLGAAVNSRTASNAVITIDGLTVQRSSNVFADVLEGISITVTKAESAPAAGDAQTSFSISPDSEGIRENVQGLVDAYNDVISFINKQEEFSEEGGPGGDLFGDPALRSVSRTLRGALFNPDISVVTNDPAGFSTLGSLGIDLGADGTITINDTEFDEKVAENLTAFSEFFLETNPVSGVSEKGILNKLVDDIAALVDTANAQILNPAYSSDPTAPQFIDFLDPQGNTVSVPGLFGRRRTTLESVISGIDDDIERKERRIEAFEETLILRFAALEGLIGKLNSQQAFLTASGL